ncbi:MAG: phosphate signaling complex protein PhoU [Pirellulaceae bacterium]|nr:phosphate signaling complex protein PhoU [Pirellulaceae bacterium]
MNIHFTRELATLQDRLMSMFCLVEQMINDATRSLCSRELNRVPQVKDLDKRVNAEEVLIEEECLKILSLYQPAGSDLRQIASILKINADLERIADLAGNIAERAVGLMEFPYFPVPDQLPVLARESTEMVRKALNAFVAQNVQLAKQVILDDASVDRLNREIIGELKSLMRTDGDYVEAALNCFSASKHFERIADHAENIAEDVIYMISGEIIRHKHGQFSLRDDCHAAP